MCSLELVRETGKAACVYNLTFGCLSWLDAAEPAESLLGRSPIGSFASGSEEGAPSRASAAAPIRLEMWVAGGCAGYFRFGAISPLATLSCWDDKYWSYRIPPPPHLEKRQPQSSQSASRCSGQWVASLHRVLPTPRIHTMYTPRRSYEPFPPARLKRSQLTACAARQRRGHARHAHVAEDTLPFCMNLAPPGTGTVALAEMLRRTWGCSNWLCGDRMEEGARLHHDHTFRLNFTMTSWDEKSLPPCLIMTVRDPVARLQSGWRLRLQRSRLTGGFYLHNDPATELKNTTAAPSIPKLSDFVDAFRNSSHPFHDAVQRAYFNSVWLPNPRFYNLLVNDGDPFLISQRDYLRGIDCAREALYLLCTERLETEYD